MFNLIIITKIWIERNKCKKYMKLTESKLFKEIEADHDKLEQLLEENDWRGEKYNALTAEEQDHLEIQLNK